MAWHTVTPTSRAELEEELRKIIGGKSLRPGDHVFRGQSDATWKLDPTLARIMRDNKKTLDEAVASEAITRDIFKYRYTSTKRTAVPANDWEWTALMQHYGAPTRLLDWSKSPFVALYFAVRDHWDRDGALWHVSFDVLEAQSFIHMAMRNPYSPHMKFFPLHLPVDDERIRVQRGVFSGSENLLEYHDDAIEETLEGIRDGRPDFHISQIFKKVIIPKAEKPDILLALSNEGISARTLFPGLDGIGRDSSDLIRLAISGRNPTPPDYYHWKTTGEQIV